MWVAPPWPAPLAGAESRTISGTPAEAQRYFEAGATFVLVAELVLPFFHSGIDSSPSVSRVTPMHCGWIYQVPTSLGGGDDGRSGRIRLKGVVPGPLTAPADWASRQRLSQQAEQLGWTLD